MIVAMFSTQLTSEQQLLYIWVYLHHKEAFLFYMISYHYIIILSLITHSIDYIYPLTLIAAASSMRGQVIFWETMGWLCHRFQFLWMVRRTGNLLQVQILWEVSNQCGESLMLPILGMRGGFSLDLDLEDEDGSGEVAALPTNIKKFFVVKHYESCFRLPSCTWWVGVGQKTQRKLDMWLTTLERWMWKLRRLFLFFRLVTYLMCWQSCEKNLAKKLRANRPG